MPPTTASNGRLTGARIYSCHSHLSAFRKTKDWKLGTWASVCRANCFNMTRLLRLLICAMQMSALKGSYNEEIAFANDAWDSSLKKIRKETKRSSDLHCQYLPRLPLTSGKPMSYAFDM